jgi:hypothetical protein
LFWGFGGDWVADPPQCATLAVDDDVRMRGWSGSGTGGIVYATVSAPMTTRASTDPELIADCQNWTVTAGNTTGSVRLIDAPHIDGAVTVGMITTTTTVVEGNNQANSVAYTFIAAIDGRLALVTVMTDPGSPEPQLGSDFAADFLVKTVSALRG